MQVLVVEDDVMLADSLADALEDDGHIVCGVAATVAMDQIKRHYYTTHDELNPKRIIPVGPGYDWDDRTGIATAAAA